MFKFAFLEHSVVASSKDKECRCGGLNIVANYFKKSVLLIKILHSHLL